jgi:hypothetical protein
MLTLQVRWPGGDNNIYTGIPKLRELFEGPTCSGALRSVLGPGYVMHAHRHMHVTSLGGFQSKPLRFEEPADYATRLCEQ